MLGVIPFLLIGSIAEWNHKAHGGRQSIAHQPFWAWFGIVWALALLLYAALLLTALD